MAVLEALANGIIPADEKDGGAAAVQAGPRLLEKVRNGHHPALYEQGMELSRSMAREKFGRAIQSLSPAEMHALLGELRARLPAFFKQLRMDVSALYLGDPQVWQRIGFPGPSTASGGYPDFDQEQIS